MELPQNKLVLIVEASGHYEDYDGYSPPNVYACTYHKVEDVILQLQEELSQPDSVAALLKNEKFVKALEEAGWRNSAKVEKIEDKLKLTKLFYLLEAKEDIAKYRCGQANTTQIDLDKLDYHVVQKLARDDVVLVQQINKSCLRLLSQKAYKQYQDERKRIIERAEKALDRARKRQEAKKQKQIEKARRILEHFGDKK